MYKSEKERKKSWHREKHCLSSAVTQITERMLFLLWKGQYKPVTSDAVTEIRVQTIEWQKPLSGRNSMKHLIELSFHSWHSCVRACVRACVCVCVCVVSSKEITYATVSPQHGLTVLAKRWIVTKRSVSWNFPRTLGANCGSILWYVD